MTPLQSFLTPDELAYESENNSFKQKSELKRLATKLLEERVNIIIEQGNNYTFEIVFDRIQEPENTVNEENQLTSERTGQSYQDSVENPPMGS
jgi:hypothetical protein